MKAKDLIDRNKPPSICIYGPAGSGKTALVSQASGAYMLDFDDGMRTAVTLNDKFTPLRQQIEFDIYVDQDTTAPRAFIDAKQKLMAVAQMRLVDKWPFDAIIIDSLTGLCRSAMMHVLGCSGDAMRVPQIQHYQQAINAVESVLTILRSLRVPVLMTAHEMLVETDAGSFIRIMSVTKPHGMNKLPWLFDEVLHMKIRRMGQNKINYIVSGKGTSAIAVRTRSGITDDVVINEIGLVGLFDLVGFKYGKENKR
ncbi:hypothetical protein LCGC14_2339410 [marine sediment metagenome]|uniref:AAA+ ATPase domain-containing protein n=1 Tax=marine sediment metagenome TaxID=412755 RepID=A0A0F9CDA0_9ZZZZ